MTHLQHVGLYIDPATNDLAVDATTKSIRLAEGAEAVGQHVRQRLMTFEGEWFLDRLAGVPWLTDIMGRRYDPALSEAIVKAEILDTDGVTEITSFSVSFDWDPRRLNIRDVEILTKYDEEVAL